MSYAHGRVIPVRRIAAGALLFGGGFVVFFGLGFGSRAVMVMGVAVMLLATSLRVITGLRGGVKRWVDGTGHVVKVSDAPPSSTFGRCEMQLVVEVPGMPQEAVTIRDPRVPVAKWPYPGLNLPIMVAANDVRNVRVLWDELDAFAEAGGDAPWGHLDEPPPPPATPDIDDTMIDFDLDGQPPGMPGGGGPAAAAGAEPAGGIFRPRMAEPPPDTADLPRRVPQPRPSPRPKRRTAMAPTPVAAIAATPAGSATPGAAGPGAAATTHAPPAAEAGAATAPPPTPDTTATAVAVDPSVDESVAADSAVGDGLADGGARDSTARAGVTTDRDADLDLDLDDGDDPDRADAVDVDDLITTYPNAHPGPDGAIHGVGITVLVADLDRSIRFYRDQLGFYEVDSGAGSAVLASGETRLVLRATRDIGAVNRRLVHLNLEVGDIDAVHLDLKAKGIRFTYAPRPVNRGAKLELWAAAFKDPDGHGIAITQWRSR